MSAPASEVAAATAQSPDATAQAPQGNEERFQEHWDAQPPGAAPESPAPPEGASPAEPGAEVASESAPYANLEDYLAQVGIEPASFYELPLTVKVDGNVSQAKLSELVKSYQLERHVNSRSIALAEQQRAWESERAQAQAALGQHLQNAQALASLAHQQLLAEYQGTDWNKLRAEDPALWAVRNTEFNNRAAQIQNHLGQVELQRQAQQQAQQQRAAQSLDNEREKMFAAIPAWREEKQFQLARTAMAQYARNLGFTPDEIAGVYDHRYMQVLHDAARYAALQTASPQAVKRVRAAPQMANPGARTARDPKEVAHIQAKERWLKNPRDQDAAAAYFERYA